MVYKRISIKNIGTEDITYGTTTFITSGSEVFIFEKEDIDTYTLARTILINYNADLFRDFENSKLEVRIYGDSTPIDGYVIQTKLELDELFENYSCIMKNHSLNYYQELNNFYFDIKTKQLNVYDPVEDSWYSILTTSGENIKADKNDSNRIGYIGDTYSVDEYSCFFDIACYLSNGKIFNAGNFASLSATSNDLHSQFNNLNEFKPGKVLIQCGNQDLTESIDYETIKYNIESSIKNCIDNGIEPILLNSPWYFNSDKTFKLNQILNYLTTKYKITLLSLWEDFLDTSAGTLKDDYTDDNIYPNRQAHWYVAEKLLESLNIENNYTQLVNCNNPDLSATTDQCLKENCLFLDYNSEGGGTREVPVGWTHVPLGSSNFNIYPTDIGNCIRVVAGSDLTYTVLGVSTAKNSSEVGDLFRFSAKMKHIGDNTLAYISVRTTSHSTNLAEIRHIRLTGSSSEGIISFDFKRQESSTHVRVYLGLSDGNPSGTGTPAGGYVEFSQVSLINLTKEGLDYTN